jgi:hypothetical protein
MSDKPKSKVEDIARRRKWMEIIRNYLVSCLLGLIFIGGFPAPVARLSWAMGMFIAITATFILIYIKPHFDDSVDEEGAEMTMRHRFEKWLKPYYECLNFERISFTMLIVGYGSLLIIVLIEDLLVRLGA